jgi:hypothetical protein
VQSHQIKYDPSSFRTVSYSQQLALSPQLIRHTPFSVFQSMYELQLEEAVGAAGAG